jgi:hypothetical protein
MPVVDGPCIDGASLIFISCPFLDTPFHALTIDNKSGAVFSSPQDCLTHSDFPLSRNLNRVE